MKRESSASASPGECKTINIAVDQKPTLSTFWDALSYNRHILYDKLSSGISELGSVSAESNSLIPSILRLHDYGILTCGYQCFKNGPPRIDKKSGRWYQYCKRPFIGIFLPQDDWITKRSVEAFCTLLLRSSKIATVIDSFDRPHRTNMADSHAVAIFRCASSQDELFMKAYETHVKVQQAPCPFADTCRAEALTRANCLGIMIASRSWEEDLDLPKLLEETAILAGMDTCYADPCCSEDYCSIGTKDWGASRKVTHIIEGTAHVQQLQSAGHQVRSAGNDSPEASAPDQPSGNESRANERVVSKDVPNQTQRETQPTDKLVAFSLGQFTAAGSRGPPHSTILTSVADLGDPDSTSDSDRPLLKRRRRRVVSPAHPGNRRQPF
ncbi:MAG: hypothetical protein Q9171_000492 [Xanthocarpia ochracea]